MKHCKLIAIDLAKSVFQVCVITESNEVARNKKFSRAKFIEYIAQYRPTALLWKLVIQQTISVDYLEAMP